MKLTLPIILICGLISGFVYAEPPRLNDHIKSGELDLKFAGLEEVPPSDTYNIQCPEGQIKTGAGATIEYYCVDQDGEREGEFVRWNQSFFARGVQSSTSSETVRWSLEGRIAGWERIEDGDRLEAWYEFDQLATVRWQPSQSVCHYEWLYRPDGTVIAQGGVITAQRFGRWYLLTESPPMMKEYEFVLTSKTFLDPYRVMHFHKVVTSVIPLEGTPPSLSDLQSSPGSFFPDYCYEISGQSEIGDWLIEHPNSTL